MQIYRKGLKFEAQFFKEFYLWSLPSKIWHHCHHILLCKYNTEKIYIDQFYKILDIENVCFLKSNGNY